jgi:hypothetical protein
MELTHPKRDGNYVYVGVDSQGLPHYRPEHIGGATEDEMIIVPRRTYRFVMLVAMMCIGATLFIYLVIKAGL